MKPAEHTPHSWDEDKLQAEFYIWFHNKFPQYRKLLFAIPNGGRRDGLESKILKATGVVRGVADMQFCFAGKSYFLELKRPNGRGIQSDDQKEFERIIKSQGFYYKMYNDLNELKGIILTIILQTQEDRDNYPHKQLQLWEN